MEYRVIEEFTDLQDNNFKYKVGDSFPRLGFKVSAERIEELLTNKNRRGFPMIAETTEANEVAVEELPPTTKRGKKKT